jgi:uncharacterized protein (TIGR02217 family)
VKTWDDLYTLQEFFIARQGSLHGFRYNDFLDHTTAANGRDDPTDTDEVIGTGDGVETDFQLVKRYTSGGVTRVRNLTKPVSGTTVVSIDDASQTSGWSVDTTTGIVTFTTAPGVDEIIKAGCEFDVPVRFGEEVDAGLDVSLESYNNGSASVPLVEIIDGGIITGEFFYGNAQVTDPMTADITITPLSGRVQEVNPTSSGLKIHLPDASDLPLGGPYFFIFNTNETNSVSLRNSAGSEVVSIGTGEGVEVLLSGTASTRRWFTL